MPEEDIMLTFIFPGMLTILCGIFALRIRKVDKTCSQCYILTPGCQLELLFFLFLSLHRRY